MAAWTRPLASDDSGHSPDTAERRRARQLVTRGGFGRWLASAVLAGAEVLGRDLVEELLELVHDLLGVLDLVLELDRGLGDHVLGGEDRRTGADGEGEGVGGPRVDVDLAPVDRQGDRRVEGVLPQLGDRDARAR